jgi:hypothetical protein
VKKQKQKKPSSELYRKIKQGNKNLRKPKWWVIMNQNSKHKPRILL